MAHVEGFGQIVTGTGGAEALDLRSRGVGADHYEGDLRRAGIGAQLAEDFVALKVGQVEIEQDQIGQMLAREFKAEAVR